MRLLSPTIDVRGLIAAHFGRERSERSMEDSRDEIDLLLGLLGREGDVRVANGAPGGLVDESTPIDSDGAQLIIAESKLAGDGDPLYVAFLGPLTDMASAILLDPEIVGRNVVVIWIGGQGYGVDASYPGIEFNLRNDIAAANVVFDSGITVWQVPASVYVNVSVGYAELEEKIGGTSKLADYLISQLIEWNATWNRRADRIPIAGRFAGHLVDLVPARRHLPNGSGAALRPGGPLHPGLRTSDQGLRVGGRPVPARGHVRQDPQVRPDAFRLTSRA